MSSDLSGMPARRKDVIYVDTLSVIPSGSISDKDVIVALGNNSRYDGFGGEFVYDEQYTGASDGILVIQSSFNPGKFLRMSWGMAGYNGVTGTADSLPSLASADPLILPNSGEFFSITGTTNFGTLGNGWRGRRVTLLFTSSLVVNDGGASMKLAGNFSATADDSLTLVHNGTAWIEISRSAN